MPYIEYLFCEHCGDYAKLDIDPTATIESYRAEGRDSVAIVQPTLIWDYLIYSCGICNKRYKYTYRDVELKVRTYFSSISKEYKTYFDAVAGPEEVPNVQDSKRSERVVSRYTAKTD